MTDKPVWFFGNYGSIRELSIGSVRSDGLPNDEIPGFGPYPFARDVIELGLRVIRERNDERWKLYGMMYTYTGRGQ
jgi:hypothetical protein